jgi:hypothetical protein
MADSHAIRCVDLKFDQITVVVLAGIGLQFSKLISPIAGPKTRHSPNRESTEGFPGMVASLRRKPRPQI